MDDFEMIFRVFIDDLWRQDPREGGHTFQERETRRSTMGDKGRQDPRKGGRTIQQRKTRRGTMGDNGRQDPGEGGHTIQHQGAHLKKALRTPTSTLFGESKKHHIVNEIDFRFASEMVNNLIISLSINWDINN